MAYEEVTKIVVPTLQDYIKNNTVNNDSVQNPIGYSDDIKPFLGDVKPTNDSDKGFKSLSKTQKGLIFTGIGLVVITATILIIKKLK